jgi:hypothetical protein
VIRRRPNFNFGTLCSIFVGGISRKYNRDEYVGVFVREKEGWGGGC